VDVEPVFAASLANQAKNLELDESSLREIKIAGTPALIDGLTAIETRPITPDKLSESGEATVSLDLPPGIQSVGGTTFTLRFVTKNND